MAKADEHNVQWKTVKLGEVGEINPSNKEPLPNQFIYIDLESVVAGELLTENHINNIRFMTKNFCKVKKIL